MATKNAAAGKFQSRGGEDFVQYTDEKGSLMSYVDARGYVWAKGVVYPDGSKQESAASATVTSIDAGTF